jgi:hypothetical protein
MISTEVVFPLVPLSPRRSLIRASFQNHELLPPFGEHAEETCPSMDAELVVSKSVLLTKFEDRRESSASDLRWNGRPQAGREGMSGVAG